jgi:hypothetical protein
MGKTGSPDQPRSWVHLESWVYMMRMSAKKGLLLFSFLVCLVARGFSQSSMPANAPSPGWLNSPCRFEIRPSLPTDFVVILDNSGSIKGDQQVWLRECVQLLVELLDPEDRISLILFGRQAVLAANETVSGEESRKDLKQRIGEKIDFREAKSDLTVAFDLLAQRRDEVFRRGRSLPCVVLVTDGFLEPESESVANSYKRLLERREKDLAGVPVYAIGLGTSAILQPLAGQADLTGLSLLRDKMAGPLGKFFHAKTLEQILPTLLEILTLSKGEIQLTEGLAAFQLDESCEDLLFVLCRKTIDGKSELTSRDISFLPPSGPAITLQSASAGIQPGVRWDYGYRFFDVIRIPKPDPGKWQVKLEKEAPSALLGKYRSHTRILHQIPLPFALNELGVVWTAAYDDRTSAVVSAPVRFQIKCDRAGEFALSVRYLDFQASRSKGYYGAELGVWLNAQNMKPGEYTAQIIAQKDDDPNFARTSPLLPVRVVEKRLEWLAPKPAESRFVPFFQTAFSLGCRLLPSGKGAFVGQPEVHVDLSGPKSLADMQAQWTLDGETALVRLETKTLPPGSYEAVYRVRGRLSGGGPALVVSVPVAFQVTSLERLFWTVAAVALAIAALLLLQVVWYIAFGGIRGSLNYTVFVDGKPKHNNIFVLARGKRSQRIPWGAEFLANVNTGWVEFRSSFPLVFVKPKVIMSVSSDMNFEFADASGVRTVPGGGQPLRLSRGQKLVLKSGNARVEMEYFG